MSNLPDLSTILPSNESSIVLSENGSYGLVVGPFTEAVAERSMAKWRLSPLVPDDIYLNSGSRFVRFVNDQ